MMNFPLQKILLASFVIAAPFLFGACHEDEDITPPEMISKSDDVPGLASFVLEASKNQQIFQDIIFTEQPDHSYLAEVVKEMDLNQVIASFDYDGKVKINGKAATDGKTTVKIPDSCVVEFDELKVLFLIKRTYEIPVIYLNTENTAAITSWEEYVNCSLKIDGKNLYTDLELSDGAQIRGRGNSTWKYYDKKPYRIKLDSKEEILGMAEAKSWVLLANYRDPTNFMNAIAFDMARYMELPYTNTNRFVEVYLNDEYIGLYQLTEQIQQGTNRINIDENTGLLLNLDLDDGPGLSPSATDNFYSTVYHVPIAVKNPEDQSPTQLQAIKEDFAIMERAIWNQDLAALEKRLDVQSMIDFLIIQELTRNVELVSPRSMYMYRDDNQIYHFGPMWDFDGGFAFDWASMSTGHGYFGSNSWLMGSSNPADHPWDNYNYIPDFFVSMFGNSQFVKRYQARWTEISPGLLDYCFEKLEDNALHCEAAMARNLERWPINKNYDTERSKMKSWLTKRVENYDAVVKKY